MHNSPTDTYVDTDTAIGRRPKRTKAVHEMTQAAALHFCFLLSRASHSQASLFSRKLAVTAAAAAAAAV